MSNRFIAIPWRADMESWPQIRWLVVGNLRRIAHENAIRDEPVLVSKRELAKMVGPGIGRNSIRRWASEANLDLVARGNKGVEPVDITSKKAQVSKKAEPPKPKPKPKEKPECGIGDLLAELEAIYQPVEGSNWFKSRPKGGSHWTPAHRKAVAKRLEDKQCLARLDWERFMAATKNFLFQVKRGDYPADRMYEPPYFIHKARKGESTLPDDTWLKYADIETLAPTKPKRCPSCKGSGVIRTPNPDPNAIGYIRINCPECNHVSQ